MFESETVAQPPAPPVNWQSFEVRARGVAPSQGPTAKELGIGEAYVAALASPNLEKLPSLLDDDAHFSFPGKEDKRGRGQVLTAHALLFGAFDDRKFALTRVWVTANAQALEWTMSGVQGRDWMGIAAARKPVVIKGLTLLWTQDEGVISEAHVYFDVAVAMAQLGGEPKEVAALPVPTWPTNAAQVFTQETSPRETQAVAVVRGSLDALEEDKEDAYLGAITDDVEVNTPERAAPARGKDAARDYFKAMRGALGQLETTVESVWGIGDYVVVEYSIGGDQRGPIGLIPMVADRVLRLDVVDVVEMSAGKIARIWRYDNPVAR